MIVKGVAVGDPKPHLDLAVFLEREPFVGQLENAPDVLVCTDEDDGAIAAGREACGRETLWLSELFDIATKLAQAGQLLTVKKLVLVLCHAEEMLLDIRPLFVILRCNKVEGTDKSVLLLTLLKSS